MKHSLIFKGLPGYIYCCYATIPFTLILFLRSFFILPVSVSLSFIFCPCICLTFCTFLFQFLSLSFPFSFFRSFYLTLSISHTILFRVIPSCLTLFILSKSLYVCLFDCYLLLFLALSLSICRSNLS